MVGFLGIAGPPVGANHISAGEWLPTWLPTIYWKTEPLARPALAGTMTRGFAVGVGRFELPASTSRTWRANQAALHPVGATGNLSCRDRLFLGRFVDGFGGRLGL